MNEPTAEESAAYFLDKCNAEAGDFGKEVLLDVVKVEAKPGYKLLLEFENAERRVFDMSQYLDKKPFSQLKDSPVFYQASVQYGTVVWPGNIDLAPETLYDRSYPEAQPPRSVWALIASIFTADKK